MRPVVALALLAAAVAGFALAGWWQEGAGTDEAGSSWGAWADDAGPEGAPARWAVDPGRPGPELPPAGRSLFDFVALRQGEDGFVYDIPFPFERLVRRVEERAGCADAGEACARQVLVPLGRSLQRTAAAPDFFSFPRAVVAVDREGSASKGSGMHLKDRLYLGYQERGSLIEVISYNEAAGRFEFQLVKDYRAGGTPRVVYANRNVCMACHQNQAPIFSRQQWDETNGNPRVAALLAGARPAFYGIPPRVGVDVPNAIDDATDRANGLAVTQLLWREGCGAQAPEASRCRAAALTAALQYRLSGERGFDAGASGFREMVAILTRNAATGWPGGLAIPNPDIPNRDPLALRDGTTGLAMSHVAAGLEPLAPRSPLEIWKVADERVARRFIEGVAEFLGEADVREVDETLARRAVEDAAVRRSFVSVCDLHTGLRELRFRCHPSDGSAGAALGGRMALTAGGGIGAGALDSLTLGGGEPLRHLAIAGSGLRQDNSGGALSLTPSGHGLRARLPDGNAIETVELRWTATGTGTATVTVIDDFGPVRAAIAGMAGESGEEGPLAAHPLRRATVMAALGRGLGWPSRPACCEDPSGLPAAEADTGPPGAASLPPAAALFERHCAACHQTSERFPPNFLQGDADRVTEALLTCAPRIFVRLSMWQVRPDGRDKTPMPPPLASHAGGPAGREHGPDPAVIAALQKTAAEMLHLQTGTVPRLDELLAGGYENLRPCLPAGP